MKSCWLQIMIGGDEVDAEVSWSSGPAPDKNTRLRADLKPVGVVIDTFGNESPCFNLDVDHGVDVEDVYRVFAHHGYQIQARLDLSEQAANS